MSKRVLIVVSSYYPAITADMHRARLLAHGLPALGYEVEILTPDASYQRPDTIDEDAKPLFTGKTLVHEVRPWMPGLMRLLDINTIGWRALVPLYREGLRLLGAGRFDLVYFSTTQFLLFCLGRKWLKKTGVPHVFDIHDPWYLPERKVRTSRKRVKAFLSTRISKYLEQYAFGKAAGIVSVSPEYPETLRKRYRSLQAPWLLDTRCVVSPFAPSSKDFESVGNNANAKQAHDKKRIAYVGAGGGLMLPSFRYVCMLVKRTLEAHPEWRGLFELTLYGTEGDWKEGETTVTRQLIQQEGLDDIISEQPQRVPYSMATRIAAESDGLLVLGIDDPAYMPSKLFSYMITGKPLLVCMCPGSVTGSFLDERAWDGHSVEFGNAVNEKDVAEMESYLTEVINGRRFDRTASLKGHLPADMAKAHAELFDRCLHEGR